jgi:ABC-type branched-subunit amino acid transport system ATPase component
MQLTDFKLILEDYPLDVFVRTPKIVSIDQDQLLTDMEKEFVNSVKVYLSTLSDLITHKDVYARNDTVSVRNWLSKLIEAVNALRNIVQLCEDMSNIFSNEISWARALAVQSMIEILDSMIQELSVLRNQVKGIRFINRIRDKTYFVIWQKIPQIFNILSTMIAIEQGQSASSEIVSAIGKGIIISETC